MAHAVGGLVPLVADLWLCGMFLISPFFSHDRSHEEE